MEEGIQGIDEMRTIHRQKSYFQTHSILQQKGRYLLHFVMIFYFFPFPVLCFIFLLIGFCCSQMNRNMKYFVPLNIASIFLQNNTAIIEVLYCNVDSSAVILLIQIELANNYFSTIKLSAIKLQNRTTGLRRICKLNHSMP